MYLQKSFLSRRKLLQHAGLLTTAMTSPGWAQTGKPVSASGSLVVAQLVDFSTAQQDVSKDFLIGSRAAWQDINSRGGIRGRLVHHLTVETDGTPTSLRSALNTMLDLSLIHI